MPVTRARPPDDAERHVGAERGRHVEVVARRPSAARRRRRPSRRPGPAPAGMRLSSRTRAPCGRPRARARRTRLSSSSGHVRRRRRRPRGRRRRSNASSSARSSATISASIRWKPSARTPVTRSERVSLAGARTTSATAGSYRRGSSAPAAAARRRQSSRASSSARASGRTPAASKASRRDLVGQGRGAASCGAGRSRPRPGRTRPLALGVVAGRRVAPHARPGPTRPAGGGTNTLGGHLADDRGVGPPRHLHRRDAVGLGRRARRPAAPPPRAAPSRASARSAGTSLEQVEHQRGGDVVRAGWPRAPTGGRVGRAEQRRPSRACRASASTTTAPRPARPPSRRTGSEVAVDLDGGDLGARSRAGPA